MSIYPTKAREWIMKHPNLATGIATGSLLLLVVVATILAQPSLAPELQGKPQVPLNKPASPLGFENKFVQPGAKGAPITNPFGESIPGQFNPPKDVAKPGPVKTVPKPKSAPKLPPVLKVEPKQASQPKPAPTPRGERMFTLDKLPKNPKPQPQPPKGKDPPEKKGGKWHWHPNHARWMWFPVNIGPPTVVIPQEFVLPQRVTIWEPTYFMSPVEAICPHCGLPIRVHVTK